MQKDWKKPYREEKPNETDFEKGVRIRKFLDEDYERKKLQKKILDAQRPAFFREQKRNP